LFAVVTGLGLAADLPAKEQREMKRTLLEGAKQLDEAPKNTWELEAWMMEVLEKSREGRSNRRVLPVGVLDVPPILYAMSSPLCLAMQTKLP
jgi:hypothetical protein